MKKEENRPREVDRFLEKQEAESLRILVTLRNLIRKTAPDAAECISYQMPAFKLNGMLCWYAVFKDHYSLFVRESTIAAFSEKLNGYYTSRGTIRFPKNEKVPLKLITEIIRFQRQENLSKIKTKTKK